ncbi:hypothetical protein BVC80_1775g2 [Macleaya cordata]|uniref:Tetratricopeptide repeat-containing domain n=1 Tax=Macleaya cordata TaxID=56857 RepID=A0A200QNW6_MACCD|nr:hypothetical protein BVC80_1775g2 [Macleaya cordata]
MKTHRELGVCGCSAPQSEIKRRVLGHGHTDYADTMYHLGTVMYLQGNEKDSVSLIKDSIRILEEGGQGESVTCLRRLRYLAQIFLNSNRLTEAENVQRKILHIMELSKGSKSLDTVIAAEGLALTLQANGNLKEAQELLEWCLDVRKSILQEDHIQISANMLHLARVAMLSSNRLRKVDISQAKAELDKAKALLDNSIRIAQRVLESPNQKQSSIQNNGGPKETGKDEHAALVILLQSLDALGLLEITKQELEEPKVEHPPPIEAEHAFRQCIAAFKESKIPRSVSSSPEVKAEYLTCLKHLFSLLISDTTTDDGISKRHNTLQELKDEIKQIEAELSKSRKHKR